jgi:hypothetical protein
MSVKILTLYKNDCAVFAHPASAEYGNGLLTACLSFA